ncbi:transcriptional regulator, PucR family [Bifidobacterium bombi DSM 19703]|uniref:Transcriptional regulator, PucR family n=2 Tax=Bifidobacterium bombi TaxID=471511 RepID=A0A080N614_9BIFI|nr:transcriptional regulator, PucR family [Bifidobacterium bombi DSM 19703]
MSGRDADRKPAKTSKNAEAKGKANADHNLWHVLQWRAKSSQPSETERTMPLDVFERNRRSTHHRMDLTLPEPVQRILSDAQAHLSETLPWYQSLADEHKNTLNLVIETAVANFVDWQKDIESHPDTEGNPQPSTDHIFFIAPIEFTQVVSLRQALDVTRVIVDLLEGNVSAFAKPGHERQTHDAILYYAREVAFSAAEIYADTAEMRESRNVRIETFAMENLTNGVADGKVSSQMSLLGWPSSYRCFAIAGRLRPKSQLNSSAIASSIRRKVANLNGRCLVSDHNELTIVLIDPGEQCKPEDVCAALLHFFVDDTPVCVGPIRRDVQGACETIHAALTAYKVAPAATDILYSEGSVRPLLADDMLPERALVGDDFASDQLYREIYLRLQQHDPHHIMLTTLSTFFACGRSLELAATKLSVHPNTVRYRLKHSVEVSGWDPTNPREAFVLQVAIKIGQIREDGK